MKRSKGATDVTTTGNEERRSESACTVVEVVLGVDTHLDVHLAVALDHLGRRLSAFSVPTTKKGYESLLTWAEGLGPLRCAGVEGTSSYGAGLARHLKSRGIEVLEVERPEHRRPSSRRNLQKSDSSDAEAAARAVLAARVHSADLPDRDGGRGVLEDGEGLSRMGLLWADGAYTGGFREWLWRQLGWRLEVPHHPERQLCGATLWRKSLAASRFCLAVGWWRGPSHGWACRGGSARTTSGCPRARRR